MAANFPDADFVLGLLGPEVYLLWHRGLTHAWPGLFVFPPALALLAHALAPELAWRRALLLCEVGFVSHVLLDVPTAWGTLVGYPGSHARLALDWLFIVDPALWLCLLAGIAGGARRGEASRRRAAAAGLALSAAYVLAAGVAHGWAERRAREVAPHAAVQVFPVPLSPWRWHAVAWGGEWLTHLRLEGVPARVAEIRREPHGLAGPAARAALHTRPGQAFLWWSRAPVARALPARPGRAVVALVDRRFAGRDGSPFEMRVELDEEGGYLQATWEGDPVFPRGGSSASTSRTSSRTCSSRVR